MNDKKDIKPHLNDENIEKNLVKFKDLGENARKEYEELYKEMWAKLNVSHLEPFAKIMLERENIVMKSQDQLIENIRKHAQKAMITALNNFWQDYGVSDALITLEVCKEKFKAYEGHNWDINSKTPTERTRPMRMRFNESRSRYLQAQLDFQQKELDETLKLNMTYRQEIEEVKQGRAFLMNNLEQQKKQFSQAKEEIRRMHSEMLDEKEKDLIKILERIEVEEDEEKKLEMAE